MPLRHCSLSFGTGDDVDEGAEPSLVEEVGLELEVVVAVPVVAVPVGGATRTVVKDPLIVVSTRAAVGVVETLVVVALLKTKGLACASAHKAIRQEIDRTILHELSRGLAEIALQEVQPRWD